MLVLQKAAIAGKKGGAAKAAALTPEQRSEIAKKAAAALEEVLDAPQAVRGSADCPRRTVGYGTLEACMTLQAVSHWTDGKGIRSH